MKPIVRIGAIAICQDGRVPGGKSTLQTEAQYFVVTAKHRTMIGDTCINQTFKFIHWLHLPLVLVGANVFIVRVFNMIKVKAKRIDTEAWLVWRGL